MAHNIYSFFAIEPDRIHCCAGTNFTGKIAQFIIHLYGNNIIHTLHIELFQGIQGMVGGQAIDIASEGKDIPFETLRFLHSCKTGALITASVQTGAVIGQATDAQFEALSEYGKNIGLAFQIVDDLLDVEGTEEKLGKAIGADAALNKATYPSLFGLEETLGLQ